MMGAVGIIAGNGALPVHVMEGARAAGREVRVVQLSGEGDVARFGGSGREFPLAAFGAYTRWLRDAGVSEVCMAGEVGRPDFKALKPDMAGLKHLPRVAKAARQGDDALLRALMDAFEREGFGVIAPQDLAANLLAPEGVMGRAEVPAGAREDMLLACETARAMGRRDIGQAAVVCAGLVLAVEAQEGTAAMLQRVAGLPEAIRGTRALRNGILAKMVKPAQDSRVDLPTIGPETVRLADAAGLAGIVVEAGRSFVIDREEVARLANEAGIFVVGLPRE